MRTFGTSLLLIFLLLALAPLASAQDAQTPEDICAAADTAPPDDLTFDQPEQVLEAGVDYRAIFCTGEGAIYVNLFEEVAPVTVNSFVFLAENGFYNSSVFHRVIEDFMVQGGDPVGAQLGAPGTQGPGYAFQDEFVGYLTFDRPGLLAMANSGPGTNGSQFFITTEVTNWLDFNHTIFGQVLTGQDVAESIPDNQSDPSLLTALDTVVIIEDPATVDAEVPPTDPVTRETFQGAAANLTAVVPQALGQFAEMLTLVPESNAVYDSETFSQTLPPPVQESVLDYWQSNGAEFHLQARLANTECQLDTLGVGMVIYEIDVYPDVASAQTALEDPALDDIHATLGFERLETALPNTVYVTDREMCDTTLQWLRSLKRIGRYVIVEDMIIDSSLAETPEAGAEIVFTGFSNVIFETALGAVFRPEIR